MRISFFPADGFDQIQFAARVPVSDILDAEGRGEPLVIAKPKLQAPPAPSLPEPKPEDDPVRAGEPRLRRVERHQVEIRCASLDQLLTPEHTARMVWAYAEGIDIAPLLRGIKAVDGAAGRDANHPRVLLALWLFATIDGVGSARELEKLCDEHIAYMWLCGGMTVNYHSLSDFRKGHLTFLDRLLTDGVATLLNEGLVELRRVAQDGMRVRASAGVSSFRREKSLRACLREAEEQVNALRQQVDDDQTAVSRRTQAARERAACERQQRVEQALAERQKLLELREQQREEKGKKFDPADLRASTTDPEARQMKMPDGGTRPAYNVQFATTAGSGIIVGVGVTNSGSDGGQMGPMLEQLRERYGQEPAEMLVDGGYTTHADIESAHASGVTVFGPIKEEAKQLANGLDPYARKPRDGEGVAEWRQRMGTPEAKIVYRERAATAEWANAHARNRGFYGVPVRGQQKVLAVALLYALAHNLLRALALQRAKKEAEAAATGG